MNPPSTWRQVWLDGLIEQPPAVIEKKRRKSVQDQKSLLRAELELLCNKAPKWIADAGVLATQGWIENRAKAVKVLKSERSSVQALSSAVSLMAGQSKGLP